MKKSLLVIICAIILCSCTSEEDAKSALLDAGYHPISVGGYGWFKCGRDDAYATEFTAYSPDCTRVVSGCVCSGIWNGKTIRLD